MDLKLTETADADNPDVGDLYLTRGQITLSDTGRDGIVQTIRQRLNTGRGEWFLDLRVGLPYYTDILVKGPNLARIKALFRQAILDTPGIKSVETLDLSLDRAARSLAVAFEATLDDASTFTSADYPPFILEI